MLIITILAVLSDNQRIDKDNYNKKNTFPMMQLDSKPSGIHQRKQIYSTFILTLGFSCFSPSCFTVKHFHKSSKNMLLKKKRNPNIIQKYVGAGSECLLL